VVLGFGGHEEFLLIYDLLLSIDDLEFTNLGLLAGGKKRQPSIIGRTCAFESKIVLDSRFLILVTRCEKRR